MKDYFTFQFLKEIFFKKRGNQIKEIMNYLETVKLKGFL